MYKTLYLKLGFDTCRPVYTVCEKSRLLSEKAVAFEPINAGEVD